jgi:glycine cleavage system H protein
MTERRYSEEHIWLKSDEYGMIVVGISDYAQEQLGDIVYVEVADVGREITRDEEIAVIESVKTTSEIFAPLSGTVHEINVELAERPEIINESPLDAGWLLRVEPTDIDEMRDLMDEDAYKEFVESEA